MCIFAWAWFDYPVKCHTIRQKLCGNCSVPQNFHTRKLGEITIFFAVEDDKKQDQLWKLRLSISNLRNSFLQVTPEEDHAVDEIMVPFTAQKMKFFIKDFFSKCNQSCRKLQIWSHLLEKSLMEDFIFCAVFQGTINIERKTIFSFSKCPENMVFPKNSY